MEIYNEIDVVFMPANTTSILQPMDQGVILTLKSYYLRNTFCKSEAAIDSDYSDGLGQSQFENFWKGYTILGAMKDICDLWTEVEISTFTGVWKNLISTLMDEFEESRL